MAQTGDISQLLSSTTKAGVHPAATAADTSFSFHDSQLSSSMHAELLNSTSTALPQVPGDPFSSESLPRTVLILIMTSTLTIGCIVGNMLVILSIALVGKLKTPCNYLIISLAVSDILVGVVVMPLAIAYEVLGEWPFGFTACIFWVTSDVTLSTSSILNLLMISVDRYLVISLPFKYADRRTGKLMIVYITLAWGLSLIISTTPLLASWFPDQGPEKTLCMVNQKIEYQMYATFGAFYLPLIIMITLYSKIFHIAQKFLKAEAKNNPHPVNMDEDEDNNEEMHLSTNSSETSSEKIHISQINNNNTPKKSLLAASAAPTQAVDQHLALPLDHNHSNGGAHHFHKKSAIYSNPHHNHLLHPDHSTGEHRHGSGPLKRFSVATIASIRKVLTRHTHKRNSQAVRTLGVIMGLFCICWLPFFILAVIAPICGEQCNVPQWVWGFLTWLGYANSCFNPIIYARFNRDFRTPFREILCCGCRKINEAVRHDDYKYQYGEKT